MSFVIISRELGQMKGQFATEARATRYAKAHSNQLGSWSVKDIGPTSVGLIIGDDLGLVFCDSCKSKADKRDQEWATLNPQTDSGAVCCVCDLILNKQGRWVDAERRMAQ